MSHLQQIKQVVSNLAQQKCTNPQCLSSGRSQLDVVWFGKQYQQKKMTCSSCYITNDQAIKKSLPTQFNVLPLIKFSDKLLQQYRSYQQKKKSPANNNHPLMMKQKRQQLLLQLNSFEVKLNNSLGALILALNGLLGKVQQKNKQIYNHQTLSSLVQLNKLEKMPFEQLLEKLNILVQQLNYSQLTNNYQFERIEIRNKKLQKQKEKINQVISKVNAVMGSLLDDIKKRNQAIGKL